MIPGLEGWSPYFLYVILLFILLAVLVGIGVLVIASLTIKRAARKKAVAPSVPEILGETEAKGTTPTIDKMVALIRKLLVHWGLIPKDELSRVFITAKKLLKKYIGGPNYMYQIPWYLMVGTEKSGKTTLLEKVNLELPIGRPDFEFEEKNPMLGWWFYDRGIVMDIRGDQILQADNPQSDEKNWRYILSLISRHRPKRPLDGIILTIPVTELVGPEALTEDQLFDRAKHLYRKLWQIQANLAMRVPVYVILTKCDRLTGFDQTVIELPPERLNEMLGWSNPYSVEAAYTPAWSDKIIKSVGDSLRRIRALIFTDSQERQNRDGEFLFTQAFESLSSGLKTYLDNTFKDSAYHESFFLRGVYLTGDGARISPTELNASSEDQGANGEYVPPTPEIVYTRDLFAEKIFKESELAQPVMRVLLSTSRILNFSKLAVFSVALIWIIGIFMAHGKFQDTKRNLSPLLQSINRAVTGSAELDVAGKESQFDLYLKDQSNTLLDLMTQVNKIKLFSLAVPSSWFSPFDKRLKETLTFAYDTVILRDLYTGLAKKGVDLTDPSKTAMQDQRGKRFSVTPTEIRTFKSLQTYTNQIANFEKNAQLYNELEITQKTDSIAQLVLYLYGKELPSQFYESTNYFRFSLGSTKDRNIKVSNFREIARQKLNELFNEFLDDAFNLKETLTPLLDLQELLLGLGDPTETKMDDQDLREMLKKMKAVEKILNSEAFKWIENKDYYPGEAYNDILTKIGASEMLGTAIANDLTKEANLRFKNFKESLKSFKADLSGPFLKIVKGQVVAQPGEKFTNLSKTLTNFMSQRFMEEIKKYRELQPTPPQQLLFWDQAMLKNASTLIEAYRTYTTEGLLDAPVEMQNILKTISENSLRKKLVHYVARAQTYREQPTGLNPAKTRDVLATQIQNLKVTTPLFSKILSVYEGAGFEENATILKEALLEHVYTLLKKIERLVRDENLYRVRAESFRKWKGGTGVAYKVFGVLDDEGLTAYLAAQRERTVFYSKDMASPVIDFLNMGYFEKDPDSLPLLLKWQSLQRQIDQYEKKTPGNDLTNLEDFVSVQMNEITINDCSVIDPVKGGGFFNTRLKRIQVLFSQKCSALAEKRFYMRYNKIAQFFNVQLAGRYPFREGRAAGGGSEASPRMIKTFYKVYDRFTPYDLKRLENEAKDSVAKGEAWEFLKQMAGVRPLLVPDQSTEDGVPKELPEYKINFRTNRDQEFGANQITQMTMKVGSKTVNWRDPDKSGAFQPGVPIQISFKWAANGQSVPRTDPAQPDLQISGTQATFNYTGNWALLKMLSNHSDGNPVGGGQTKIWRLRFEIPTTNVAQAQTPTGTSQPTVVFIDFELTEKGVGPSTKLVDLSSQLPTSAKLLDEKALAIAEKSVEAEIRQAEQAEEEEEDIGSL